jgi:predicted RNA binding protein YcfA (HicA-like mRNA interferase family)
VSEVPLCSSEEICNALRRAGFVPGRAASGDHQFWFRENPDDTKSTTTVVLGRREVPRGTLRKILRQAGLTVEEFRELLK